MWYDKVAADPADLSPVGDAYDYFTREYEQARKDLQVKGKRIELVAQLVPGMAEHRYGQLQEIEAILRYLEIKRDKLIGDHRKRYLEHYNRALSDSMAGKYAENEDDVHAMQLLVNQISLLRNRFLSITKGIEFLHFQLNNITRLRAAGMEDATL